MAGAGGAADGERGGELVGGTHGAGSGASAVSATVASATSAAGEPIPWSTAPASRLQAIMNTQAWWKDVTLGTAPEEPRMATRHATPSATPIWRDMA